MEDMTFVITIVTLDYYLRAPRGILYTKSIYRTTYFFIYLFIDYYHTSLYHTMTLLYWSSTLQHDDLRKYDKYIFTHRQKRDHFTRWRDAFLLQELLKKGVDPGGSS